MGDNKSAHFIKQPKTVLNDTCTVFTIHLLEK